ncbi:MAG: CHAD domain-containing protein [Xanthobacteraceae bacterium]|nr:CHAD domain-containing protein [Xanthobacteraceae bacterium]
MTKRPALRPDIPLDQALSGVARDILTKARDAITDPGRKTDEAIHDFRKSIKRWRSFLRLIQPHFGDGADNLRAAARDTARKLGGARDLRSMLDAVEDIRESAYELNERALDTIGTRIEEMQAAAERHGIGSSERAEIANEVTRWLTTISLWPFSGVEFSEISKSLAQGYRRARKTMPENWEETGSEELHEFRRRTIDHRYQMELIEPLWPRMAKIWVDEAQRLRDALGKHRDLALLQDMAGPHQPLARFRSKLTPAIARRQQEHLAQAAKIASRVFAEKPRAFQARIDRLWRAGNGED